VLQNDFLRWQKLFFDSLGMQQQYSLQELPLETKIRDQFRSGFILKMAGTGIG
jgi:hypothetical protein